MSNKLEAYRKAAGPLPEEYLAWEVYGAGFENVGREGKPVRRPLPKPGPNELLARVDAVGLCFSDIKVIKLGAEHPRLAGRDLTTDPVVPGHEVSVTVVEVGDQLKDRYQVGQKLVVQADAFFKGQSLAFGYALRGGAAQYTILNEVLHSGDEGSYLLPAKPSTGYSEAALSEPWACVEASYHIHFRSTMKPRGRAWFISQANAELDNYFLGEGFDFKNGPQWVYVTELAGRILHELKSHASHAGLKIEETVTLSQLLPVWEKKAEAVFDDIIIFGKPRPGVIERVSAFLGKGGHLAVVCPEVSELQAEIDLGRIHYDRLFYIGTATPVMLEAYRGRRASALIDGGAIWIIGAGGPMGQMHLQRALDRANGPRIIVATDVDEGRLEFIKARFSGLADKYGKRLVILDARNLSREMLLKAAGVQGFSDIILLAPIPKLAEEAWGYLAEHGMLNIFAGVAKGTKAKLRMSQFYVQGSRLVGSSGSGLSDIRFTLAEAEAGKLATDKAVAAVGGINALREGLAGVAAGKYPGKIVIYPQVDFPLLALGELQEKLPRVADKLEEEHFWNREAEAELLEELLP